MIQKRGSDPTIPEHLGIILDGNRRWARDNNLPTLEGHRRGYDNLKDIAKAAFKHGVSYVSAYIFSTENWNRTKEEVDYLMNLAMKIAAKDAKQLIKENVKILVLGSSERVNPKLMSTFKAVEEDSKNNTGGTVVLCFNYGGMRELRDAVRQIVESKIEPDKITEQTIANNLYHPEVPPVDLMIRTSGEHRISNFMLWRIAYSELYFVSKHWPSFTEKDLKDALQEYAKRHRRFGAN